MAVPLDKFVQHLTDSGVLDEQALKEFLPPSSHPQDAQELARELVRKKKLSKFQAEEAYKGKAASLVLGNYILIERIGAGGMGQVFKARHRRMNRLVAIKLLPASLTKDKAAIARFEREVLAAAKIIHPNIVAAYDADQANGAHFLVMELVEGSDLSAVVKKQGSISHDRAVSYILQAAKGLEAAHAAGIVHRDIKPANLLLDASGTVKILDMGLARLGNDDGVNKADLTSTGMVMGTIDYMSPEQAMNTKSADARADIYSLGCSLFYLLTGRATYDGDSLMAKLIAHREFPIPSLRDGCHDAPPQLDDVFRKMVAKTTDDRFQTMTEVVAALEQCRSSPAAADAGRSSGDVQLGSNSTSGASLGNFLQGVTVVTQPPAATKGGPAKPAPRPAFASDRKKMLLLGGAGLGALVIVALLAGVVISMQKKPGTKTVAEKRTKKETTPKLAPPDLKPANGISSLPPPVAPTPEALRATVTLVLERGGVLNVFTADGKQLTVSKIDQLPSNAKTLERISFGGDKVDALGDGLLEGLKLQPDTFLIINSKSLTNAGLAKLSSAPRSLDLRTPKVTSEGLVHLTKLKGLESFHLGQMLVSGPELAGLSDSVTHAGINCPVTPEALAALAKNRRLKGLGIFAALTPRHLEALRESRLDSLDVNDPGVDDEAMARLVGLDSLRRLVLQNTKVTAKGLAELKKLKSIDELVIMGESPLKADDLKAFSQAMPRVQIRSHAGNFERSAPSPPADPTSPVGSTSPVGGLPSPGGSALEFNGQGSRVEIPTLSRDEAGPLTIEAFVTLAATSGNIVVRMEGKAGCQLYGWPNPSNSAAEWVPNAGDQRGKFQQGTPSLVLNRRYHLALQFDKDTAQLYIDGKLANSQDRAPASAVGTLRGTTIGAHADGSAALVGSLDEIRISSVRRYKQDFEPQGPFAADADTLALYHCDEGEGATLRDSSGKNHHGQVVGAKWVKSVAGDHAERTR